MHDNPFEAHIKFVALIVTMNSAIYTALFHPVKMFSIIGRNKKRHAMSECLIKVTLTIYVMNIVRGA